MESLIKQLIFGLGADLCGIANIDRFVDSPPGFHPTDIYPDCKSVIVFAKHLPKGAMQVSPRLIYLKITDSNLAEIDRIAYLASLSIEKLDAIAVPMPSDTPYEYWDEENLEGRGLMSMAYAAYLAGLGSIGKNGLLINKKYGNMIHIGAILINQDLRSDPMSSKLCIEGCSLCIDNCPQKALDGITTNQKLCREHTYNTTNKGFPVCNCNTCRTICPMAYGVESKD